MIYIDCLKVRDNLFNSIKENLSNNKLSVVDITIGNYHIANTYINQKQKLFKKLNINYINLKLNNNIKENDIINIINLLNVNKAIDGIILTLPIPNFLNYNIIVNTISKEKDIDCLTTINKNKLSKITPTILPPTVLSIMEIFKYYHIDLNNKLITIIGNGKLVGNPLSIFLKSKNYNVITCNSKNKDLKKYIKSSDVIITATGTNLNITPTMLKENVIIIDAGTHIENNHIKGDIDQTKLINFNCSITPVPKGVGTITTLCLIKNLLNINQLKQDKRGEI